jgi:hypothetical protein
VRLVLKARDAADLDHAVADLLDHLDDVEELPLPAPRS